MLWKTTTFLLAKLTYNTPLSVSPSVSPSVSQSPFLKILVRTTPPKRLDGLSWNLQGIFLRVSSCAPDKNFWCLSVSKSVSYINEKKVHLILSRQFLLNGCMDWASILLVCSLEYLIVLYILSFCVTVPKRLRLLNSKLHQNQKVLWPQLLLNSWMD